jgi:hypothetical protein
MPNIVTFPQVPDVPVWLIEQSGYPVGCIDRRDDTLFVVRLNHCNASYETLESAEQAVRAWCAARVSAA